LLELELLDDELALDTEEAELLDDSEADDRELELELLLELLELELL
jgi:hypothetical protein